MCGRGANDPNNRNLSLEERDILHEEYYKYYPSYNIAPTQDIPIMTTIGSVEMAKWWLIPSYSDEFKVGQYSMFNKKSEELDKPYWKGLLSKKRCVIPLPVFSSGKSSTKQPRFLIISMRARMRCCGCAGLYDDWINKETGEVKRSCTILTMEPNDFMKEIHNRMPRVS